MGGCPETSQLPHKRFRLKASDSCVHAANEELAKHLQHLPAACRAVLDSEMPVEDLGKLGASADAVLSSFLKNLSTSKPHDLGPKLGDVPFAAVASKILGCC